VAKPTLPNSSPFHQLFAGILRPFARPRNPKARPEFRVFPTGKTQYHWQVVALAANRPISRHKSLTLALRKCIRLNKQHSKGVRNENN
jgi:hypothetical protein